jgi:hypothetical protein
MKPGRLQWVAIFLMLFVFSTSTTGLCCVPAPSGLVDWWPAEGNANDSVGGNNGTLVNGVSFTNGMVGQAFSLDGTSSYVSIPDSPSLDTLTTSITIEAWIKVNQFPDGNWTAIVTKGDSSWRLHRYWNGSTISFGTTGPSNGDLAGNKNVNDGQWHHVAGVYDGTNKFLYVDGTLDVSAPATGSIAQNNYPVCIGENAEQTGRIWNGLIDEVSIYNRALTATEIQSIYSAGSSGKCPVVPPCASVPSGLVSWWPGEDNADDVAGANNGTLVNGAGFAAGEVGQAFSFDGTSYVSIPDSPSLDTLTTSITIEAWIKVNQFSADNYWTAIVTKGDSSWRLHRYSNGSTISFSTTGLSNADLAGNKNVNDGQWHHVAGVYDGTNKFLYVDGALDVSTPATGSIAQNNYPVCIGENAQQTGRLWNGLIDEVSVYNRALSAAEIQSIYNAGSSGKCPFTFPVIISQPTNQTVGVGGAGIFNVMVSGAAPLSYQWNHNGTNILGATNATLTLTNVQFSQAGNYAVLVTNAYGLILSSNAVLTVIPPPTYFVSLDSTNPIVPYLSWDTAATDIQDAVDVAISGGTILVSNGVYNIGGRMVSGDSLSNRVVVTKAVNVRSVNGSAVTMIDGGQAGRSVYLANGAVLTGFTLTNGNAGG